MHYPKDRNRSRIAAFPHLEAADAPPIVIDGLIPDSDGGRAPIRRVTDQLLRVEADVHAPVGTVTVRLHWRKRGSDRWASVRMQPNERNSIGHAAELSFSRPGEYEYAVGVEFLSGAVRIDDASPERLLVEPPTAACASWLRADPDDDPAQTLEIATSAGFDIVLFPDKSSVPGDVAGFLHLLRDARQKKLEVAVAPRFSAADFYAGDWRSAVEAARATLQGWADLGVRAFRLGPESIAGAPPAFWIELLKLARADFPDLVFSGDPGSDVPWKTRLALAKTGFGDVTIALPHWTNKASLKRSVFDLGRPEMKDWLRPSLWPDFTDPEKTTAAGAKAALALAATLSPVWGLSTRQLLERHPSLMSFLACLNEIRRTHPAMRSPAPPIVCHCPEPQTLCLLKALEGEPSVLVVIDLSPSEEASREAVIQFPRATEASRFVLRDLFNGRGYRWRGANHRVALDGSRRPVRIFAVEPERDRPDDGRI